MFAKTFWNPPIRVSLMDTKVVRLDIQNDFVADVKSEKRWWFLYIGICLLWRERDNILLLLHITTSLVVCIEVKVLQSIENYFVYIRPLPELYNPTPNSDNLVLFFRTSKTTFCVMDRKNYWWWQRLLYLCEFGDWCPWWFWWGSDDYDESYLHSRNEMELWSYGSSLAMFFYEEGFPPNSIYDDF